MTFAVDPRSSSEHTGTSRRRPSMEGRRIPTYDEMMECMTMAERTARCILDMPPSRTSQAELLAAEETLRRSLTPMNAAPAATLDALTTGGVSHPTTVLARSIHRLAQLHALQGNHADASRLYSQILTNCASIRDLRPLVLATAWYDVGLICLASGQPQKAVTAFQQSFGVPSLVASAPVTTAEARVRQQADTAAVVGFVSNAMKQVEGLLDCMEGRQSVLAMTVGRRLPWSIELLDGTCSAASGSLSSPTDAGLADESYVPTTCQHNRSSPSTPSATRRSTHSSHRVDPHDMTIYAMDRMFHWAAGAA